MCVFALCAHKFNPLHRPRPVPCTVQKLILFVIRYRYANQQIRNTEDFFVPICIDIMNMCHVLSLVVSLDFGLNGNMSWVISSESIYILLCFKMLFIIYPNKNHVTIQNGCELKWIVLLLTDHKSFRFYLFFKFIWFFWNSIN